MIWHPKIAITITISWIDCILPKNASGFAPPYKCSTLSDMNHIVATYHNRLVVEITSLEIGILETLFPIKGRPPINPKSHIMCLGLILSHFILHFLKDDCTLPPSSMEWKIHKSEETESWEFEILDQHDHFRTLMKIERGEGSSSPKKIIKLRQSNFVWHSWKTKWRIWSSCGTWRWFNFIRWNMTFFCQCSSFFWSIYTDVFFWIYNVMPFFVANM